MASSGRAPGHPGIPPRWTSSAKSGVGTAIDAQSRVWFTLSHGIINEVYFPRLDQANTRDFGLIVTDRKDFFSEEKRDASSRVAPLAQGVPGYRVRVIGEDRATLQILVTSEGDDRRPG